MKQLFDFFLGLLNKVNRIFVLRKPLFVLVLLVSMFYSGAVLAQSNIVDEVIWVVGDEYILKSEVEELKLHSQYEGMHIEGDPYCVFPEQIAIQKLFLHQAQLDSVTVPESTVNMQVEYQLNRIIAQIGSVERMEEYFKKSLTEIRSEYRDRTRDQLIISEVQRKLTNNIKTTPAEVRRFYNKLPADSVPTLPTQVELQILSFEPPIAVAEVNRVKDQLRSFIERVNNGTADFSVLARMYSDDLESAKRGGELDFKGKGELVPEFSAVAFSLQDPKRVSRIVQTEFGYHIIQLIEKKGDRVNCRHILIKPKVSVEEKEKAILILDTITRNIRDGKLTFEQAVNLYSQDKMTVMNAGLMINPKTGESKFEFQDLPADIARQVYSMNVGEITKPFIMTDQATNKDVVAIVKMKSKIDVHKANLTDDYQLLKGIYENKLRNDLISGWIAKKQQETYIKIDPHWINCTFQYPGWIKK